MTDNDPGPVDFEETAPGVWKVADKDQDRMQESIDNALRKAFGKGIAELFPDA
jgi:hypothetical protein